jgi:hypothetical protein
VTITGWTRDWDNADDEILMMARQAHVNTAHLAEYFCVPESEVEERIYALLVLASFCRTD